MTGFAARLPRRSVLLRLVLIVALLGVALAVRASGVTRPSADTPPPLVGWTAVAPGIMRGSQPTDLDFAQLRDSLGVRGVVDVDGTDVDERAVVGGLGLRFLVLDVAPTAGPSAGDLIQLSTFVSATEGAVYLHDSNGHGPVVTVASALRVLRGTKLSVVLRSMSRADLAALSAEQLRVLADVDSVARGEEPRDPSYAALRGVNR